MFILIILIILFK